MIHIISFSISISQCIFSSTWDRTSHSSHSRQHNVHFKMFVSFWYYLQADVRKIRKTVDNISCHRAKDNFLFIWNECVSSWRKYNSLWVSYESFFQKLVSLRFLFKGSFSYQFTTKEWLRFIGKCFVGELLKLHVTYDNCILVGTAAYQAYHGNYYLIVRGREGKEFELSLFPSLRIWRWARYPRLSRWFPLRQITVLVLVLLPVSWHVLLSFLLAGTIDFSKIKIILCIHPIFSR